MPMDQQDIQALAQAIGDAMRANSIDLGQLLNALSGISNTVGTSITALPQYTGTTATATGGAATLPANPVAFGSIVIGGTAYKVPLYT